MHPARLRTATAIPAPAAYHAAEEAESRIGIAQRPMYKHFNLNIGISGNIFNFVNRQFSR
jgi:hypothetical protein